MVGIIGPNGAGKSTLIKTVMGLIEPEGGFVKIFDKEVEEVRDRIAYVPQRESVDWDFPASVLDVALMGLYDKEKWFQRYTKADKEMAKNCLDKVGMLSFSDRQISQLSGGQQQRVFLARALARNADFYLMDEPFAGVDATTETSILELLQQMRNDGKTLLIVHHDLQTAHRYFDWFVLLNRRLIACGPRDEVFTDEKIQETYGSRISIIEEISNQLGKEKLPTREF
ncbi:UNVERIFIED_CONTAM: hypothetical protein GTU68_043715 [Idotea baltica]|nr:hypothetical protein [Idotea baltica]